MTIFGRSTPKSDNNTNATENTNNGGFDPLVNSFNDTSKWHCSNCGECNSNTVYTCTRCGERKKIQSNNTANNTTHTEDGWKCSKCGKINQHYVGTCGCGMTKQNNVAIIQQQEAIEQNTQPIIEEAHNNTSSADEIKKYKELLDMGAITQEEYDKKKKELLGF